MTEPQPQDVMILVHGIRDIARWESEIRSTLERHGFSVEPTNYGRMNLIEFLLPIGYFRRRAINTVWTQIEYAQTLHPGANFSVIAHSFGTHVIAQILKTKFTAKFKRVIFCGSVVRYSFPFEQFSSRYGDKILNEVGTGDPWPAVAQSVTFGYGSAGTYGFNRPGIRDRFHNDKGHGYFLSDSFCETYWIPYLKDGSLIPGDHPAKYPPSWVVFLSIFKMKYLIMLVAALFIARSFMFQKPFSYSLNSSSPYYSWGEMVPTIVDEASQQCPFDFIFADNCTHSIEARIVSFFTGRRYLQVQEFDGDTLRRVISCKPYSFYGVDPVAALESLSQKFRQCISIEEVEDTTRVKIDAATKTMTTVSTSKGRYDLCQCEAKQIDEFRSEHP